MAKRRVDGMFFTACACAASPLPACLRRPHRCRIRLKPSVSILAIAMTLGQALGRAPKPNNFSLGRRSLDGYSRFASLALSEMVCDALDACAEASLYRFSPRIPGGAMRQLSSRRGLRFADARSPPPSSAESGGDNVARPEAAMSKAVLSFVPMPRACRRCPNKMMMPMKRERCFTIRADDGHATSF